MAALLWLATLFTTTTLGAVWWVTTRTDRTWELWQLLDSETVRRVWGDADLLHLGLQFSLATLFILGCHEMGHYLVCRRYGLPCTPPYFLPAPFGFGTLGAFIRIRSPLRSRRELFDMGVAGPIAGFVALLPFLVLGAKWSSFEIVSRLPSAVSPTAELVLPGRSLALRAALAFFHGPAPADAVVNFHPFALAAWVGLFATALNLLPLGQLDGGHILYAAIGRRQHRWALPLWGALAALALVWPGWALWAAVTLLIGVRHPPIWGDESVGLDSPRIALAIAAGLILLLSFSPVPLSSILIP